MLDTHCACASPPAVEGLEGPAIHNADYLELKAGLPRPARGHPRFRLSAQLGHAFAPVFLNGEPSALFQTYEPTADPIGECYDVRPGDYGVHVMMAPPDTTRHGFTAAMLDMLADFAFRDPAHQRVVIEPDARNDKAIARFAAYGLEVGELTELPHKTARLAFLTRENYEGHSVERSS